MSEVFLSLGSNIGNKVEQIEKAYIELENSVGQIVSKSSFYETAPLIYFLFLKQISYLSFISYFN